MKIKGALSHFNTYETFDCIPATYKFNDVDFKVKFYFAILYLPHFDIDFRDADAVEDSLVYEFNHRESERGTRVL